MPPAAVDQFFTSRASSVMHNNKNNTNKNKNNDNINTNHNNEAESQSATSAATTLRNLINYNNNDNNNNNSLLKEGISSQGSSTHTSSSSNLDCRSCLLYQSRAHLQEPERKTKNTSSNNFEGLRKTSLDLVNGDLRNMTSAADVVSAPNRGHHTLSNGGACHSSKVKSNSHRTPCTNLTNGLSHSYYDCCINVHVSALLDHWLDWPSNHCPNPSQNSPNRRSSSDAMKPYPLKRAHAKDGASNTDFTTGRFQNGISDCFLSDVMSSESKLPSCKTVSSSCPTPFCVYGDTCDISNECEGCKLFETLSCSSSLDEGLSDSFILEKLASHIGKYIDEDQTETLSNIRKYFAAKGCDIVNYQDFEGKTLLHHSITGDMTKEEELVRQLLEEGADPNIPDYKGETPLLLTRCLFEKKMYSAAYAIVRVLIYDYPAVLANDNHIKVNVNANNEKGGSLLSYAVQYGDKTADVTRLLLNSGASVWKDIESSSLPQARAKRVTPTRSTEGVNCSQTRVLKKEDNESAFKAYLRSLMSGCTDIKSSKQTLYMLCTAMESQQQQPAITMGQYVDKTMLELGVAPKINGPLFKKLRAEIAPFIAKPQSLRFICIKSIRKSIGKRQRQHMLPPRADTLSSPSSKRMRKSSSSSCLPPLNHHQSYSYSLRNRRFSNPLTNSNTTALKSAISGTTISNCKLKLPHKLQQFVCLEEMVVPN